VIDLSLAYNGRVFSGPLPEAKIDVQTELALLAPGGPNRRVFLASNEERAPRAAMACLEGPWARYGGFVPRGVGTIIVDPLLWARHLPGLSEICQEKGINLVSDERKTSPGLSGHPFLCEAFGAKPDALLIGRGWANGEDFYGFIARPSRLTESLPEQEETDLGLVARAIAKIRGEGLEMARDKGKLIKEFLVNKGISARGAGALWLLDVREPDKIAGGLGPHGFSITRREGGLVLAPALDLPEDALRKGLEALGNLL